MDVAIITEGFYAGSESVKVMSDIGPGFVIQVYDDETKELLGTSILLDSMSNVPVSPPLYLGQRIIAYIDSFGNATYGAVVVTASEEENTGWKVPETVDGVPYDEYLNNGGAPLPDIYDPEECRNFARDMDAIDRVTNQPITFTLYRIERMNGTIQMIVEDIQGAVGGYKTRWNTEEPGTNLSKVFTFDGTYIFKIWRNDQDESQAVEKIFILTMPTPIIVFGTTIVDLSYHADYGNTTQPGLRPLRVIVYSSVPVEVQIDGIHTWAIASGTGSAPGETGRYEGPVYFVPQGEYTIRCRKLSDGTQELSRQIKLNNYFS